MLATAALCLGLCATPAAARELEIPTFLTPVRNSDHSPATAPGGRPFELFLRLAVNQSPAVEGDPGSPAVPAGDLEDLRFDLPAGIVANAASFPRCSQEDFAAAACPLATQVGVFDPTLSGGGGGLAPVFNLTPPAGEPAQFGMRLDGQALDIDLQVRNGGDYGVSAAVHGLDEDAGLLGASLTIWGVPADPGHDGLRFTGAGLPAPGPYPEPFPYRPLLSDPGSCDGPLVSTMEARSWQQPSLITSAAAFEAPQMGGCDQLEFSPRLEVKPTTNLADSPSGLEVHLQLPQNQDAEGSAVAHLRTARVALPAGLAINPAAANGLGACSLGQIGYAGVASERQILRYDLPPVTFSRSFTVSYGGTSTAPILATATRAQVTAALETLPGLAGNVSLAAAQGGWIVSFTGALSGTNVAQFAGSVSDDPSQLIAVTGEGGSFELHFGAATTGPLPFDASADEVEEALAAIPALGRGNLFPGNVFVSGGGLEETTRTYRAIFAGDLTGTEPAISATSSLSGAGAGVQITHADPPPPRGLSVATLGGIAPGTPQFNASPAACPDAAKIGTARIDSPAAIGHPLFGSVYLASPRDNPFGSLLALYVVVEDPATGLVLKLPGRVEADPQSGRLSATIGELPQLPFEDLRLDFFKGAGAPLRTPNACGGYGVQSELTPWGAPETAVARPGDSFAIAAGAGGGSCPASEAAAPVSASFEAGTVDPAAGAYSPFVLRLSRPDGARPLSPIDTTLPEGLLAKLAATASCPDAALASAAARSGAAEQAAPSCPAASRLGGAYVAAGAGPTPYNLAGSIYLAGPYKGAPLSLASVVPVLAGPFDLGTVVQRAALYLDPETTRVHVVADPLPAVVQGIPLDLRSLRANLDAAEFTRNPTSCNPLAISGAQSIRFQAGDCARLAFAPKLTLAAKGPTRRDAHPGLSIGVGFPGKRNQANLAALGLTLPGSVRLDRKGLGAICSPARFAARACPAASVRGRAEAVTPLLGEPLKGPVYLRRSRDRAEKLPELVADLRGRVDVVVSGQLAVSKAGVLSANFEDLPDAPFTKFTLTLAGGKKGFLVNAGNLCAHAGKATALIDGQNAKAADQHPVLSTDCAKGNGHESRSAER
ncbi:MAG TPA: hypothetical protein VMS11_09850 [Solirubrobacterales bacterium]|nr:hypothetical protein [Solirubrobacterales bacterium]